jgi:hypothetical protein
VPIGLNKNIKSERCDKIMKDGKPIGFYDKVSKTTFNLAGIPVESGSKVKKTIVNVVMKESAKEDVATVTLTVVGDPWGNGTGVQLLLDEDAEIVDHFDDWMWNDDELFYSNSEYKIPENASYDFNNPHVIHDGTGSVDIPGGVYDFLFLRPWPMLELNFILYWAGTDEYAMGDDFLFLAGFEYVFTVETAGEVAFETPEDIKMSDIILPQPSLELTDQEIISVVLYNNGIVNITGDIELAYKVNGGTEVVENYTISELLPGAEITYTFNTKANFSAVGFYTVEARVEYESDSNPYNNTITGQTKKLELIELPFEDKFDTPSSMLKWIVVDGNKDGVSWQYDDWFLTDADGGKGCLQVLSQSYGADEYLITDPIAISEPSLCHISFYAYGWGDYDFKLLYGTTPNVEEMELLEVLTLDGDDWAINNVDFELETPGNYFFAFHYFGTKSDSGVNFDNFKMEAEPLIGIPENLLNEKQLRLYPNPVSGVLNVELKEKVIDKVVVYNMLGKNVHTVSFVNDSLYKLNTTDFAPGIYFIYAKTETEMVFSKFVVK